MINFNDYLYHFYVCGQAESDFQFDLEAARREGDENVNKMESRKNQEIDKIREKHRAELVLAEESHLNRMKAALFQKEEDMNIICSQKLAKLAAELNDKHEKAMLQAAVDFDFRSHQMKNDFEQQLSNAKKKSEEVMILLRSITIIFYIIIF